MEIRSLQVRTALMRSGLGGEVVDRGGYIVARTPANPTYRWGNYLVFPAPPGPGDLARWCDLFAAELGDIPGVVHQAFAWDGVDGDRGDIAPFREAGFDDWRCVTLSTETPPAARAVDAELRSLETDADWERLLELATVQNDAEPDDQREDADAHHLFMTRYNADRRRWVANGNARWFGAFRDGRLVSSLGLIVGGGLGRYQSVDTHPEHRRQGLGGALIAHAGREAIASMGARSLVIVAEEDADAYRLYTALGFTTTELCPQMERFPRHP